MGRYTRYDDPLVDAQVGSHLDIIRNCILACCNPDALVLSGSFGRGEGSVYVDGSEVRFLSDYEVVLISSSPLLRFRIERMQAELARRLPVSVSLAWITPGRIRNNRARNLTVGSPQPSIHMYELKAGSQVFHGEFALNENMPDPRALPISEAIRLVENRMMDLVEKWSQSVEKTPLAFSLAKLILACGDALLLRSGCYHYSYAERARRFSAWFQDEYSPILGDEFLPIYCMAASFKLLPFVTWGNDDILSHIDTIRLACKKTLGALSQMDLDRVAARQDQASPPLGAMIPISYRAGILPIPDPTFENLISAIRCRRAGKTIHWTSIPRGGQNLSVIQLLHSAIPFLFFAVPFDGARSEEMLEQAVAWGRWALGPELPPRGQLETALTQSLCSMWHTIS